MSELQKISMTRNSYKGRVKGLRNNIRGMLAGKSKALAKHEIEKLTICEKHLNDMMKNWDSTYEQIKSKL